MLLDLIPSAITDAFRFLHLGALQIDAIPVCGKDIPLYSSGNVSTFAARAETW